MNNLLDHILHLILSLLPATEEAARTSILSTRWRYLWTLLPSIDLDCTRSPKPFTSFIKNEFKEFVYWVLLNKTVDLESFRLSCVNHYNLPTVERWIHSAVMRKVKRMDLSFCPRVNDEVIKLPYSLVKCDSLEALKLFLYKRSLNLPTVAGFIALRVLELKSVRLLDGDSVQQFLNSCPLLEELSLINCFSYSIVDLCISCPNLKTLRIHNQKMDDDDSDDDDDEEEEEEEEDYDEFCKIRGLCERLKISCPKLAFLEYVGQPAYEVICENLDTLKKSTICPDAMAQKGRSFKSFGDSICQLLAGVSHVESLSLNHYFIRAINAARDLNGNFPASLGNLKTLEISTTIDKYAMDVVIRILRFCANLESFYLIIVKACILRYLKY
ncbi:F-box/FBD/LRR-repeat protein At3g52680-like [Bidens hawaiensis]|uniref:F-box/FBD/LRR-repeat protein At3g52680-like n=1 Tax=Bidens hawaiensis TaxID=980011 RepID=UPI00404B7E67